MSSVVRLFCTPCSSERVFDQYRQWGKNVYVRGLIRDPSCAMKEHSCAQTASAFLRYESVSAVRWVVACNRVLSFRFHIQSSGIKTVARDCLREDFFLSARNVWTGFTAHTTSYSLDTGGCSPG
jgi:hypothetical protein